VSIFLEEARKLNQCQLLLTQGELVAVVTPTGVNSQDSCMVKIEKIYVQNPDDQIATGDVIRGFYKNLEVISPDQKKQVKQ